MWPKLSCWVFSQQTNTLPGVPLPFFRSAVFGAGSFQGFAPPAPWCCWDGSRPGQSHWQKGLFSLWGALTGAVGAGHTWAQLRPCGRAGGLGLSWSLSPGSSASDPADTAPGSDLQGELGVHLLPSIEGIIIAQHRKLPQALSGLSGEINSTAWIPYILPWLAVPLHSWGSVLRHRVNVIVDIPQQRNCTAISFFYFSSSCTRLLCYQLTISYKKMALC